jgi:hypothetical protein
MSLMRSGLLPQFRRLVSKENHHHRFRHLFPLETSPHRCKSPLSGGSACCFTSGSDHHAFFQQQLEELEKERTSLLGPDPPASSTAATSSNDDLIATGNALQTNTASAGGRQPPPPPPSPAEEEYETDIEEMHSERDALFQFSAEEKQAWGSQSRPLETRLSPELLQEIEEARRAAVASAATEPNTTTTTTTIQSSSATTHNLQQQQQQQHQHHESFSHLSPDGKSIHMVDVGHKQVTTRMARAQSKVILPPEVLEAFEWLPSSSELVGPKGPIFSTAKIAGILAAK